MSQTAPVETSFARTNGALHGPLVAVGVLLAFALTITLFGRSSDIGAVHMPSTQPHQVLLLHFADREDGGVTVTDASSGAVLQNIAPGTNGFLRSLMRGFAHERSRNGIGPEAPFTLTRWSDGTLSVADEKTGRRVNLDAFGPTQAGVFAGLFSAGKGIAP